MAIELATAYVAIVPSAEGIGKKLAGEIGEPVQRESKESGKEAGKGFMSNFRDNALKITAAAGAAIGAAVTAALWSSMSNEKAVDRIGAALGLDDDQSKALGKAAGAAYTAGFGESMEQVAEAAGSVVGAKLAETGSPALESLTKQALALSEVFGVEVPEATNFAAVAIRNGIAKDGAEAFDLLTAAMQRVPEHLRGELVDATNEYGPMLRQLGYTGEQAMALLVKGAEGGQIALDKTGDAIKEFTIRATDMSTTSVEAYKAIGLNAEEMANAILAGGDTAAEATAKIIDGLLAIEDPATRANTAIALFGTPLEDLGTENIPAFLESLRPVEGALGDFAGAADRAAAQLTDNAATKIEAFRRKALAKLTEFIADQVLPAAEKLGGQLVTFWEVHGDGITNAASTFADALKSIGTFLIENVLPPLVSLGKWVIDNKPVLIGLGVAIATVLVAAFTAWAVSAAAAAIPTIALYAPIVAITAAIAALVAGVVYAYQEWDWFRTAVDKVADFFTEVLWPALKKVADFIANTLMPKAVEFGSWLWDRLGPIVSAVASWFADTLWPALKKVADFITGTVIPTIGNIIDWLGRIGGKIKDVASDLWGFVLDVYTAFGNALDFIRSLPGRVADAVRGIWDGLKRGVKEAVDWVLGQLDRMLGPLDEAAGKVGGLLGKGAGAAKGVWNAISSFDTGGVIGGGRKGDPQLVLAHVGETVLPTHRMSTAEALGAVGIAAGGNTYILNTYPVETSATVEEQFRRMELVAGFAA